MKTPEQSNTNTWKSIHAKLTREEQDFLADVLSGSEPHSLLLYGALVGAGAALGVLGTLLAG